MLNIEKTVKEFGYDPSKLKHASEKTICFTCDYCNTESTKKYVKWFKGRKENPKDSCTNMECISKKRKETFSLKYPEGHPNRNKKVQEKRDKTNLERYGCLNVFQSDKIKQKAKKTCLEKYGVEHHLQNPEIMQKQIDTNIERYGVEHVLQNKEIKTIQESTVMERFGTKTPAENKEIYDKMRSTCLKIYGRESTGNLSISDEMLAKLNNKDWFIDQHHTQKKSLEQISVENGFSGYTQTFSKYAKKLGIEIRKHSVSMAEKEIQKFLTDNKIEFIGSDRKILEGKEIDILIPSKNLGLEYCGLFWHNEDSPEPRLKDYHNNKTQNSYKKGIRLITIFEDEWRDSRSGIENYLKSVLGIYSRTINGRDCEVKQIDKNIAKDFLNKTHIQKSNHNTFLSMGIFYKEELLGVMTFSKHHRIKDDNICVLSRMSFLDGVKIHGGSSKLFKNSMEKLKSLGYKKVISWSDNRYSQGNVYSKMGFTLEKEIGPDYSYVDPDYNHRKSKQSCKKSIIGATDKETEYSKMKELGYSRIWDCGKKRWIFNIV